MIEFIDSKKKIPFTSYFKWTSFLSGFLVIISIWAIVTKMNYGVDFKGGAEVQIKFQKPILLKNLRKNLEKSHFKNVIVQTMGVASENEYLLKISADEENLNKITHSLSSSLKKYFINDGIEIRKVDIVGPKAGDALSRAGAKAIVWAILSIMIYIALRFDFKYSPGAVAALLHDVIIILGIFALCKFEFTLQTVAALLAVIGYSVNDTVIVYDRVREHEAQSPDLKLSTHIDRALSQTLSRTILTSGTTLFISLTMFFYGGESIENFFMAVSLGVGIGTYSSIFIAAPITILLDKVKV